MSHDDDKLMQLMAKGKRSAFDQLFHRYSKLVYGYCYRLSRNQERAEDYAQMAWMKVVKAAESYQGQGSFKAWLMTLTRNVVFNELRRVKYDGELDEERQDLKGADLEKWFEARSDMSLVKTWIDELPEQQGQVLLVWATEGLSYEELAGEFKTSVSSIKSLLFRARKNLEEKRESYEKK